MQVLAPRFRTQTSPWILQRPQPIRQNALWSCNSIQSKCVCSTCQVACQVYLATFSYCNNSRSAKQSAFVTRSGQLGAAIRPEQRKASTKRTVCSALLRSTMRRSQIVFAALQLVRQYRQCCSAVLSLCIETGLCNCVLGIEDNTISTTYSASPETPQNGPGHSSARHAKFDTRALLPPCCFFAWVGHPHSCSLRAPCVSKFFSALETWQRILVMLRLWGNED